MGILLLLLFIQLYYWVFYFYRVSRYQILSENNTTHYPPVSIVVCFKNEDDDIEHTLNSLANQDYPEYEIIFVNDFSEKSTLHHVEKFIKNYKGNAQCTLHHATQDLPGKKHAQHEGVLKAQFSIILFTDMDCIANSQHWIRCMVNRLEETRSEAILGYGPMVHSNNFISWFSGFETVMTAIQYFGYQLAGQTYMGVGRNLMIKKEVYLTCFDFAKGQNLASGDDDLLISAMAQHSPISICLDPDSFLYSKPKSTLFSFLNQKNRHISTSRLYSSVTTIRLFVFSFSILVYYGYGVSLVFAGLLTFKGFVLITICKWILQSIIHIPAFLKLDGKRYILLYPIAEMCLVFYYMVLSIFGIFSRREKW